MTDIIKAKNKFLEGEGRACPYCESDYFTHTDWQLADGTVDVDMICGDCGQYWRNTYTLSDCTLFVDQWDPDGHRDTKFYISFDD